MLLTKFRFIWQSGYREDCLEINQSETRTKYVLALISLYDNMVYGV
jgi:hypothetical protein